MVQKFQEGTQLDPYGEDITRCFGDCMTAECGVASDATSALVGCIADEDAEEDCFGACFE
jgi:hypothetical protein